MTREQLQDGETSLNSVVDTSVVREMTLPGVEVDAVEADRYDAPSPGEEADFQLSLQKIREAERRAWQESRHIIL